MNTINLTTKDALLKSLQELKDKKVTTQQQWQILRTALREARDTTQIHYALETDESKKLLIHVEALDKQVEALNNELKALDKTLVPDRFKEKLVALHVLVEYWPKAEDNLRAYITGRIKSADADERAWMIYFLSKLHILFDKKDELDAIFSENLKHQSAKVRQWTVYTLGELYPVGKGHESKGLVGKEPQKWAIDALLSRWNDEYDVYVLRQIVITLGKLTSLYLNDAATTTRIADVFTQAATYPGREVREQVDDAIQAILTAELDPNGKFSLALQSNASNLPQPDRKPLEDHKAKFFTQLLKIADVYITQELAYENYRNAILTIEIFAQLLLLRFEQPPETLLDLSIRTLQRFANGDAAIGKSKELSNIKVRAFRALGRIGAALTARGDKLDEERRKLGEILKAYFTNSKKIEDEVQRELFTAIRLTLPLQEAAEYFKKQILAHHPNDPDDEIFARSVSAISSLGKDQALKPLLDDFNRLSKEKTDLLSLERLRKALTRIGGEAVVTALVAKRAEEIAETNILTPLKKLSDNAIKMLETAETNGKLAAHTAFVSQIAIFIVGLLIVGLGLLGANGPITAAGGVLALLSPVMRALFDPNTSFRKAISEVTKGLTAYHSYLTRSSIVAVAVSLEFTKGTLNLDFLKGISQISSDAMRDSALIFDNVGVLPDLQPQVDVPDLKGKTMSAARGLAADVGLRVELDYEKPVQVDATLPGAVISVQSPEAKQRVSKDTMIRVKLSNAP